MATLITTTGSELTAVPGNGKSFTPEELQDYVGGMIQFVCLPDRMILGRNGEGKMTGLPENRRATRQYGRYLLPGDYLVGDILILSQEEAGE